MGFEERIDPELREGLGLFEALGLAGEELTAERLPALRVLVRERMEELLGELPANEAVVREDRRIPGPDGELPVRIYRPAGAEGTLPCLVWIHGGGMVMGTLDMSDLECDGYAEAVGCVVVSVDYRLAPEHPHPAPVEDCYAALSWAAANPAELGIDAGRIAVGGSSAGGGLAAGAVLLARDRGGPAVAFQMLVYPMLDDREITPSSTEFPGIASWSTEHNRWGWTHLLAGRAGAEDVDHYAAPARATDLSGLPPALIQVGELEVFRDEDIDYAARLLRAALHPEPAAV
jgi:acetyl esterase/lipase